MEILYHYTDLNGLLGIIQHRKLWLTSAFNLNDHQEVIWAIRRIKSKILDLQPQLDGDLFDIFKDLMLGGKVTDPYVCSLTSEVDLLSQWRAYGKDGTGVSIGIKLSALPNIEKPFLTQQERDDYLYLAEVVYSQKEQDSMIDKMFAPFIKVGLNIEERFELLTQFAQRLIQITPTFKNPAFREEAEWRIIYMPMLGRGGNKISEPNFRISGSKLIPYFEYVLSGRAPNDIFAEIMLGPKCETSPNDLSIFLAQHGLRDLPILRSKASYR